MKASNVRQPEAGFAMLVVFLLAAVIAISLYLELPRVVLESQRSREELLIDRGEQYKRAIQLYFRARRTYPPSLEALENTNNKRYLRRRYKDPMTGEEEWRLIHAGPGGVFTDSLLNQSPAQQSQQASSSSDAAQVSTPLWQQSRPSDRVIPLESIQGSLVTPGPATETQSAPAEPGADMAATPAPEMLTGSYPEPVPGQPSPQPAPVTIVPGQPAGPPPPGALSQPSSTGPTGAPAFNPAAEIINRLLTTPTTRGTATLTQTSAASQIGGGIAGVASRLESESIKVYNDRTKYNEWEFTYNASQDRMNASLMTGGSSGGGGSRGGQPSTEVPGSQGFRGGPGNPGQRGGPGDGSGSGPGRRGPGGTGFGGSPSPGTSPQPGMPPGGFGGGRGR